MDGPNASDTISKLLPSDLRSGPVAIVACYETTEEGDPGNAQIGIQWAMIHGFKILQVI